MDTDQLFLIRKGELYDYCLFFKLKGECLLGFSAQMFNIKARGPLLGAKKFVDAKFKLQKVTKGKFAWKEFDRELE